MLRYIGCVPRGMLKMRVKPDFEREERCGIPEVILGLGKSNDDLLNITKKFLMHTGRVIVTKIDVETADWLIDQIKREFAGNKKSSTDVKDAGGELKIKYDHNSIGNVLVIRDINFNNNKEKKKEKRGKKEKKKTDKHDLPAKNKIGILTAGTSDIPVAEEARVIARELGCETIYEYDVGIAGIHRVFFALERMKGVSVLIVIAGMEGALPSVVSGLVDVPVIGVPSSVGYGTGAGGKTALYTMLNSCTPVAVVNIDNGYGAAVLAYQITRCGGYGKRCDTRCD